MIFENIKTGEKVVFGPGQDPSARQAHIAAYLNSSDMSPNALKGQDFGWRLSPEIKYEVERIKSDIGTLEAISRRIGVGIEDVQDFHIVSHVAEKEFSKEALEERRKNETTKFKEEYESKLNKLREERTSKKEIASVKIEEPTKEDKKGK